ncbi:low affinity immunoglobulin gamma Fc region receptor II-c-like protein [Labeo rohita]|nr:low affinity immunoglobulin gamma Fc region receptor II-c-like protein [Labeo rohita]
MKEIILRENPEILLSDYSGSENNRVWCNLLFFTEHPLTWHTTLCSTMTCKRKGGISKGRQLTLEGENDTKLNLYHNGTVMVQGPESSLNEFQKSFRNLKQEVQKIKKDPKMISHTVGVPCTTPVTISDTSSRTLKTHRHTSTLASPKIKALRDKIAELKQDFFLFKEETSNNLHHLLNLTSHHSVQQLQQLCSAVKQLEEDNQELRRVREELSRREKHGHTLERLLEETRNQLHTIQQQQCVSTQTHDTLTEHTTNTTQYQQCISSQSQSSFTPATCQSPQAIQNVKRKENSSITQSHPPTITSPPFMSTSREQKSKDNFVILCDSNGHHLDPRRLFPGRSVKKFWCPTSHSALRLLRKDVLGAPSHVILHTATNDLSARKIDVTKALFNVEKTASRIYHRAKINVSNLLPRKREWIANSTKLLFELCPGSTRKLVAHTGPQKDSKNIRSCLKLLNEAGENVPRFVSHHLDELPPVTFNSLDVSCLLGKIEQLSVDFTTMKQAVSLQTNTYNDLRIITTDINQRLSAIEQPRPNLKRGPVLQTIKPVTTQRVSTPQACEKTQDDMEGQTSEGDLSQMENSASGRSGVEWSDMAATPPWNLVQDKRSNNRRKQVHENASVKLKPRLNPHKGKKPAGIFGTGGRSQSPSTVSQQQNNSQTSDHKQSEAEYNTLQSGTAHIYDSVDAAVNKDISTDSVSEYTELTYAEIELKSTKKQKKKKENKGAGSSDVTYTQLKLKCQVHFQREKKKSSSNLQPPAPDTEYPEIPSTASPNMEPSSAASSNMELSSAAAPHVEPSSAASPNMELSSAAAPHMEPSSAAAPNVEPSGAAVSRGKQKAKRSPSTKVVIPIFIP